MKYSFFAQMVLGLIMLLGFEMTAFGEANYVYHEQTTSNPGCGANNYMSTTTPGNNAPLTIAWKTEFQNYTTQLRVYYTTDGTTPSGSFGTPSGTTQVITGAYSCTFGGPVVDVCTASIPAQPAGTVVKYIISAWHSGGGDEIFANGPGSPCSGCGTITNNSSLATVFSYTVVTVNPVEVTSSTGSSTFASYATLAAAITAINGGVIHTGTITCNVAAGHTETAPAGGFSITATGTLSNPIIFQKSGSGANPTFTANGSLTSGALNDAIVKIIGGDYITIDGFTMLENAANLTTTAASNNMTEWGVALLYASTTNGSQNNTIKNNNITLNKSYTNTFGIYSNVRHSATAISTTADITNSTTAPNSGNKVYNNTISNVNMGITFIGSGTAANQDIGNDIGGSSVGTGNTITNWGGAAAASGYISNSGTSYCIFMNHQVGDNVSYNTITSATISGTSLTLRGILKDYTSTGATIVGTTNITNNTITITDNFTSGTLECIRTQGGVANTSTLNINNNTILNTSVGGASSSTTIVGIVNSEAVGTLNMNSNIIRGTTSTATTGGFTGISNTGAVVTTINMNDNQIGNASGNAITFSAATSGAVLGITTSGGASTCTTTIQGNDLRGIVHSVAGTSTHTYIRSTGVVSSNTVSSNTFTNLNVNTTGAVVFIDHGYSIPSTGQLIINNNAIVTAYNRGGSSGSVILTTSNSTSGNGSVNNYTNNNFSNITVAGTTTITGFNNTDGGTGSTKTITGNTFNNWTAATGAINTMNFTYWNGVSSLSNNTITNITGQSSIVGLTMGSVSNAASSIAVSNNTINNLTSTGAGGAVTGITCSNTSTTININNNGINTLSSTGASAVSGIAIAGATTTNVFKNKIYDLSGSNASSTVNGILVSAGTTINLYNNLVGDLRTTAANAANPLIGISITGGTTVNTYYNTVYLNGSSSGALFGSSAVSASSTPTVNLRNNIFVNNSTPSGSGSTVAYRRSTTTLTNYANTSNNNLFYAGTPGANRLIFFDGTNSDQTLAAFKTRVGPTRDAASVTENPNFASTTGSSSNFLHFAAATSTLAESGAANIATFTDDFDAQTRQGNGGYSGTGLSPDIGADEFEGTNPAFVPIDMQPTALVAPTTTGCYTNAETVTVTIKNNGTSVIDYSVNPVTVGVAVTGAVTQNLSATLNTGTLGIGASQNVNMSTTLDMSTAGTYNFALSTTVTGDGNTSNDNLSGIGRIVISPVSLPQSVNLTGFTGSNLTSIFPNWYEATGATLPSGSTSVWTSSTAISGSGTTAKINLFTTSSNEWLVGPKFIAANGTLLTYKIAITDYNSSNADPSGMQGTDDRVIVRISTNCGVSFSDLFTYNAANTASITNSLVSQSIDLSAYAGQEVILAFFATDGPVDNTPDYDFHIDDINIATPALCTTAVGGTAAGSTSLCTSGTPTITASGYSEGTGSSYQWIFSTNSGDYPTGGMTVGGQTNPAALTTGVVSTTTYYWLRVQCATNSSTDYSNMITVTVNAVPTATAGNNSPVCAGSDLNLTLTTNIGTTFSWTGPNSFTSTAQNPAISAATTAAAGTYNVTVTAAGCTATSTTAVTVNPAPGAINISPASPSVCSAGPAQLLTASGGIVSSSVTVSSGTINQSIPDNSSTGTNHTLSASGIPAGATIDSVIVTLNITHTFDGDVEVNLQAPNGQIINLLADQGSTGDNFTNTRISSDDTRSAVNTGTVPFTGTFRADKNPQSNLIGSPAITTQTFSNLFTTPNGNWIIRAYDDAGSDLGTLNNWSVKIAYTGQGSIVWTPNGSGNGLYSDASATTLYTGTPSATVYTLPVSTTQYTATVTLNGCSNTGTVTVTTLTPAVPTAPATYTSTTINHTDGAVNNYVDACNVLARLTDASGGNVLGNTTVSSVLSATVPSPNVDGYIYGRRKYTVSAASTGAATLKLYFTQADFDNYNANNSQFLDLPTSGNNADPNKPYFRIARVSGGTYTISGPLGDFLTWNSTDSRWEVDYTVTDINADYYFVTMASCDGITVNNLQATNVQGSSLVATWDNLVTTPAWGWYSLRYKPVASGTWTDAGTSNGGTTSKLIIGLVPGTAYEIQIRRHCSSQSTGPWSSSVFFNTPNPPCSSPPVLTMTMISANSATMTWPTITGAGWFEFRYSSVSASGPWTSGGTSGGSTTSKVLTGLSSGTTYYAEARTFCASNGQPSEWGSTSFLTPTATGCALPPALSATTINATNVTVTWPAVGGAGWYEFRYKLSSSGTWITGGTLTGSAVLKLFGGLTASSEYNIEARTFCASNSQPSAWGGITVTTASLAGCELPPSLTASTINANNITVTWPGVIGAAWYEFRYKLTSSGTWISAGTLGANANSKLFNGLTVNTSYDLQARTFCSNGQPSAWGGITVSTAVAAVGCQLPPVLSAGTINVTNVTVTWPTIGGAGWFEFRYSTSPTGPWTSGGTVTGTAIAKLINGLSPATTYYVQARTFCASNSLASDWSGNLQLMTLGAALAGQPTGEEIDATQVITTDDGDQNSEVPFIDLENTESDVVYPNPISTLTLYPNPTRDLLNVVFYPENVSQSTVLVLDLTGRILQQIEVETTDGLNAINIDLGNLPAGMYMIQLRENGRLTQIGKAQKLD